MHVLKYLLIQACLNAWKQLNVWNVEWRYSTNLFFIITLGYIHNLGHQKSRSSNRDIKTNTKIKHLWNLPKEVKKKKNRGSVDIKIITIGNQLLCIKIIVINEIYFNPTQFNKIHNHSSDLSLHYEWFTPAYLLSPWYT